MSTPAVTITASGPARAQASITPGTLMQVAVSVSAAGANAAQVTITQAG